MNKNNTPISYGKEIKQVLNEVKKESLDAKLR